EVKIYTSSDSIDISDVNESETFNIVTLKFLNSLTASGFPNLRSMFSHDQFYLAISRAQRKKRLKILIHDTDDQPLQTTTN
ncbi:hypothetical protein Lal_00022729, partial [Lupinus albus]